MTDSMQTAITQVPIQTATVAVMALKEADTGTRCANLANAAEAYRLRHGRPALRQLAFDWKAPDK